MTDVIHDIRSLVKVVEVDAIESIPDADNIETVVVGGWRVVVRKGEFTVGDKAIFAEVDSCLPIDDPRFAFLEVRGVREYEGERYHRLRTVKLRGVISQGLVVPVDDFVTDIIVSKWRSGGLTAELGVLKWDDIAPQTANLGSGQTTGQFPSHLGRKTDAERIQNLKSYWGDIKTNGPWVATEKIDGTSLSVFRKDGELIVCSRNWAIKNGDNTYWNAVLKRQFTFDNLPEGFGVQGEIYGEGIQGNPLGVKGVRLAVFNYLDHGVPMPKPWPDEIAVLRVPHYPLELPETVEEAIAQADGIKSLVAPGRLAEGVVWHHAEGREFYYLGYRSCFKVLSNRLPLKEN